MAMDIILDINLLGVSKREVADLYLVNYRSVTNLVAETLSLTPTTLELSVVFTNDSEISKLNHNLRSKNSPTNVLSIPTDLFYVGQYDAINNSNYTHLGDVLLSFNTIYKEAQAENISIHDHTTHLFIHSLLHLLGYDHDTEERALPMENMEVQLLSSLGIKSPYHH